MKVLLLEIFARGIPLSLRSLANYALKDPYIKKEVQFDLVEIPIPYNGNLEDYLPKLLAFSNTTPQILSSLKEKHPAPDVVCMSIWMWNYPHVLGLSKKIKDLYPNSKLILGGFGVLHPEKFLKANPQFDAYCYERQGEEAFTDYLYSLLAEEDLLEVPGFYYRDKETLKKSPQNEKPILVENLYGLYESFPIKEFSSYEDVLNFWKKNCSENESLILGLCLIFGLQNQTIQSIKKDLLTMMSYAKHPQHPFLYLLEMFPGSIYFETKPDWFKFDKAYPHLLTETNWLSPKEMIFLKKLIPELLVHWEDEEKTKELIATLDQI